MTSARFVELAHRGVTLCTERAGDGPPLLVLGGTGSDIRNHPNGLAWPVAKHHDTLIYDHRGLGRSRPHDLAHQPTMADFALDAIALCDAEGFEEFAVIGVSFGGMVAQEVAIRAGTRVPKLVLCCTASGGHGGASHPLHEVFARGDTLDDLFDLWDIRSRYDPAVAELMRTYLESKQRTPEPPPGLLRQVEARRHHDTWHRLHLILADTMIAHGIYDGVAPPERSEALATRIVGAKLASFVGGHMFLWQDRAAWPAIERFLGGA